MTDQNEVADRIRKFILEHFALARKNQISDDDTLLESGIVDSMGLLEILQFLEEDLDVTLSDDELVADNFESISTIANFIFAKIEKSE